jgi:hypothetical protein
MLRFTPSRPGERSRMRATRALFTRHGARAPRKVGPCGFCGTGCRRPNGRSSQKRAISRSSAETPASSTGSMRAPRRMSASSTKKAARSSGCVSCRWASCRSDTSCSPRRSRWKAARAARSRWPEDSLRTVSRSGELGHFADTSTPVVPYETFYALDDQVEQLARDLFTACGRGAPQFLDQRKSLEDHARIFWDTYSAAMKSANHSRARSTGRALCAALAPSSEDFAGGTPVPACQ